MPASPLKSNKAIALKALRSCQLFANTSAEEIEKIASFSVARHITKGSYLFHEGNPSEGFFIVQQGAINIHRVSASGKEQILHVFRAGESFAEGTLASKGGYPAAACAITNSTVVLVPKMEFIALLQQQPKLSIRMLGALSHHLRILVALIDDLTLKDVESRLANWFLKRCPYPLSDTPTIIRLEQTKRILAAELGTVSETFSRTLAKFRDQNLIKVAGKSITVISPIKLNEVLRKNLGEL
ncbi:MAG: Crp/Fnr family transcriptional regulator [Chthoniobacterales bacterium]